MVSKDQAIGWLIFLVCVVVAIAYSIALIFPKAVLGWVEPLVAQIWLIGVPVYIAFVVVLAIGAWIGWTMATTPPPKPIEEIEAEEKVEEEKAEEEKKE
ncbi:MAG: hypothetical protein ACE5GD_11535 [Candidatus Geothermarchaeales archaeon]